MRYAKRLFLYLFPLLIVPLFLFWAAFVLPPQYTETFLGAFYDKACALRAAEGKRILIAGGSGAAFALRCDLLEEALPGYKAVNLGMYAGLGSLVSLDLAVTEVRSGDIVVFLPEESPQTLSAYFGSSAMWQAADGHWSLLKTVRKENLPALAGEFPYFAAQKASFFFGGISPRGDGIYARSSFNAYGDIESPLREKNVMPLGYDPNMPISFTSELPTEAFFERVNAAGAICRENGAVLYYGFCPMNAGAVSDEGLDDWAMRLDERLDCPVLYPVRDSLMDPGWFYDTNFHLNSAGAIVYTARLAGQLRSALGLSGSAFPDIPDMPKRAFQSALLGDNSDADGFLYEEDEMGVRIVGLSEKGKASRRLTLPVSYRGKSVLSFESGVFAGSRMLEELVIQRNIRLIPDRAFDGCTSLGQIILRDLHPSECTVGLDLLGGTDAVIVVDAELYAAFVTDYFWSNYAPRIHILEAASADAASLAKKADPVTGTAMSGSGSSAPEPPESSIPEPAQADGASALQPALEGQADSRPLPDSADIIRYDGNGGCLPDGEAITFVPFSDAHLRMNTLQGTDVFMRPGHVLVSWNTSPDGSGTPIGLGSRIEKTAGQVLYAQWMTETPQDSFTWKEEAGEIAITGFSENGDVCVIPGTIDGLPVRRICPGAFTRAAMKTLVIPPSVTAILPGAFSGCAIETLYLYDTLSSVSDDSFSGCEGPYTLHLNAATPPVYSTSYYASFADKYDRLLSLAGQKKLVLFAGSSTRYGYDSSMLHKHYLSYEVVNMGVYAYTNALPQMDLILSCLEEGDVLLHAPEFDCLNFQTCENTMLDFHFWAMMEANYDCAGALPLASFSNVFDSLGKYLSLRRELSPRSYDETPNGYDDDGNNMRTDTYNLYGDFIMPRANNKVDIMLKYVRAEYTPAPFTSERLECLNREYQKFREAGVTVLFTYSPRNRSSISEDSTPENRKALDRLLREKLTVPVISNIEDSLMSGVYFFVIDSHLSTEGVRLHTLQIIKDLKPFLPMKL